MYFIKKRHIHTELHIIVRDFYLHQHSLVAGN
jgi:hypothetical protein